jgi:hypothetical protein
MNATVDGAKVPPAPPTGTATVVIGCKIGSGIIIEVGIDKNGNKSERYRAVTLNGKNASKVIGGFGLTTVDKNLWEEWLKTHQDLTYIKKGLVFVQSDDARASAQALQDASKKTGLESLQDKDERLGKGVKDLVSEDKTQRQMGPVVAPSS